MKVKAKSAANACQLEPVSLADDEFPLPDRRPTLKEPERSQKNEVINRAHILNRYAVAAAPRTNEGQDG